MLGLTGAQVGRALDDLHAGLATWRIAYFLAWQDVKQRYRRSTLGPLWQTLSFGMQMLTMSIVNTFLFHTSITRSMPFVCAGMLFWSFTTQMINEGASLFVTSSRYITQIKLPLSMFLMQAAWRNVLLTAHNATIYVVVALIFGVAPGRGMVFWPIAFVLVLACSGWMALFGAILSARYRDVPLIIQNVLSIVFWFAPLMYFPEQLGENQFILEFNPFTHMVALVRDPLLGTMPSLTNWIVVIFLTIAGWVVTFLFFARFRARIVYWL